MNYTDVTSPFILERIRNTHWEDRKQVDDLIQLWKLIKHPPNTFNGGMALSILSNAYAYEYLILLEEHSPELLKQELERRQEREQSQKEELERYEAELRKTKELWLQAGGKP